MSLDSRMAITSKGGHYVGSVLSQKPNDANRYASLTCAVSADKTSFSVLRQTSLYGTAATTNNDIGANVVLIEGYYDDDGINSSDQSGENIDTVVLSNLVTRVTALENIPWVTYYTGSSEPDNSQGENGDLYLQTD